MRTQFTNLSSQVRIHLGEEVIIQTRTTDLTEYRRIGIHLKRKKDLTVRTITIHLASGLELELFVTMPCYGYVVAMAEMLQATLFVSPKPKRERV